MKFLGALLCVALAFAAHEQPKKPECTDDFGNVCAFRAGDVWQGTYGATARAPQQTGKDFKLIISQNNYAVSVSEGVSVFQRFIATDDFISIADLAATPAGDKCPTNQLAKYEAVWSNRCNTLELHQRYDPCGRRGGLLRGATGEPLVLTKQACPETYTCGDDVVSTFHGKYSNHADGHFEATIGHGVYVETSEAIGASFGTYDVTVEGNTVLSMVGGQYQPEAAMCARDAKLEYGLVFMSGGMRGCKGFTFSLVDGDDCEAAERFEGVTFHVDEMQCTAPATAAPETPAPERHHREHVVLDGDRHFKVGKKLKYMDVGVPSAHRRYDARGHEMREEARAEKKGKHVHKHHSSSSSSSSTTSDSIHEAF